MSATTDPTATMADSRDDWVTPARLRSLPSRLLTHTAMHAERLVNEGLAGADARKWHYAVLVALQEAGPASQATLSRRAGLYRSDLVAVINELADRGYVERAPDPGDRRRNVITITQQGRRHLRRLDKVLAGIQDDLLAPLTQTERDQLTRFLTRLLDHHAGTAPTPPAISPSRRTRDEVIDRRRGAHRPQQATSARQKLTGRLGPERRVRIMPIAERSSAYWG